MARAARAGVDSDEGHRSTPQRALVLLTSLLVVAALALFALQWIRDTDSSDKRRVTAAPTNNPTVTTPTTTAPVTSVAPTEPTTDPGPQPPGDQAVPPAPEGPAPQEASTGGEAPTPTSPANTAGPAPAAWYVTFHGGDPDDANRVNNVLAYDREGTPIPTPVLTPAAPGLPLDLSELRAMAFGADGTLFVVNSSVADSKVLAFGGATTDGTRPFLGELSHGFPPSAGNPGMQHPYGLAFDGAGHALVSSQDTQVVTRLFGPGSAAPDEQGTPAETAPTWCPTEPCEHYPGTFAPASRAPADLPQPPPAVSSKEGGLKSPRGIAYVSGNNTVYVADNADGSIKAYDATTGSFTGPGKGRLITAADGLSKPVGMAVHNGILYVADEGTDTVLALDLITPGAEARTVVAPTEGDVTLDRPSGLAFDRDGALYVASRRGRQVVRYELSGDGVKVESAEVFLDDLPDQPEQIVSAPG